jgi:hypothetical protein
MLGIITTRHLVTQAPAIVSSFGLRAYFRCVRRCLFSGKPATFLECVWQH